MNKKTVKIRFKVLKDGWIKDIQKGLEWGKSSSDYMNFSQAQEYCKQQKGLLPSLFELESIKDLTVYDPCIDKSIFTDTKSGYYWSDMPYVAHNGCRWCVSFNDGRVYGYDEYFGSYVRPVRASQ